MDSLSTILREVIMKEKIIKISKKMFIILLVVLSLISLSKFVLFFSPNYIFYHPNEVKIYTKNEKDYYSRMFNQFGKYVTLDEISPHLINAAVASEDKRFYKHDGIDYLRIIKSYLQLQNMLQICTLLL